MDQSGLCPLSSMRAQLFLGLSVTEEAGLCLLCSQSPVRYSGGYFLLQRAAESVQPFRKRAGGFTMEEVPMGARLQKGNCVLL